MPTTITETRYTYAELDDAAKATARKYAQDLGADDTDWAEFVISEFVERLETFGVEFDTRRARSMNGNQWDEPVVYWTLNYSQGDGAQWFGSVILETWLKATKQANTYRAVYLAAKDSRLSITVRRLEASGNSSHSGYMVTDDASYGHNLTAKADAQYGDLLTVVQQWAREQADQLYHDLRAEYEYQTSEPVITEWLENNDASIYAADGTT